MGKLQKTKNLTPKVSLLTKPDTIDRSLNLPWNRVKAAAKHAAFVRARGRHYSNEAEAMKRAAQLMAEDDEDEESSAQEKEPTADTEEGDGNEPMDDSTSDSAAEASPAKLNGIVHK